MNDENNSSGTPENQLRGNENSSEKIAEKNAAGTSFSKTAAFLLLRFWTAIYAISCGLSKFSGTTRIFEENVETGAALLRAERPNTFFNYSGISAADFEFFQSDPLFPNFLVNAFSATLGYALIFLGATILLGIFTRISLLALGAIFTLLTLGISLQNSASAGTFALQILTISAAILLSENNKFALTKRF